MLAVVVIGAIEHSANEKRAADAAKFALGTCQRGNDIRAWQIAWAKAELKSGQDAEKLPLAIETIRSVHIRNCKTGLSLPKVAEDAYVDLRYPQTLRPRPYK